VGGHPLGVFIGKKVSHGKLYGHRTVIFTGDELDPLPLVFKLPDYGTGDFRGNPGSFPQITKIGKEAGIHFFGRDSGKICGYGIYIHILE
jgi:hypothetical protein